MEKVYPISVLANGGLLGDVLYFSISGFLLCTPNRQGFFRWYAKRLKRVYLATWIAVGLFAVFGVYGTITAAKAFRLFLWPTEYHFVSSILVLYIVYYFLTRWIQKGENQNSRYLWTVLILSAGYFFVFYALFDRSFYHIDNVYSPMIWFLYLFAMLIGMRFRMDSEKYLGKTNILFWLGILVFGSVYGLTKFGCVKGWIPTNIQWVNQLTLLITLSFILRSFIGLENVLKRIPESVMSPIRLVASMAFEIYLVQIVLIPIFNIGKEQFPKNLLIVLGVILLCAYAVHTMVDILVDVGNLLGTKRKSNP